MPNANAPSMTLWQVAQGTFKEWSNDHASRLAAAVAYYATFSIAPLLMIAIAMLGIVYGPKAANDQLRPQLANILGDKSAAFIQELAGNAAHSASLSLAGILSVVLIIYAATNLFIALQDALNVVFKVQPKPNRGIKGLIADRALSFFMVLILGALVLGSVVLSAFLAAITKSLPGGVLTGYITALTTILVSVLLFTGVFAALFKFLPDVKIDWHDTLIGAACTSIVFSLARIGLSYYLGRTSTSGPFGAAGSLVVVLLFIYYSSQVLFLGAEFTQVWARRNGQPITPSKNATCIERKQGEDPVAATLRPPTPPKAPSFKNSPHYPAAEFHPPLS